MQDAAGRSFSDSRYLTERTLGEGSKKRVYLARDSRLERDVALAVLKSEELNREGRAELAAEARALARLGTHPHVVAVLDMGEETGSAGESPTLWMATEYLPGGDLRACLDALPERRLPIERALAVGDEICQALAHAHGRGLIHRDLSPGNVWLAEDGTAKVGDFGLGVSLARTRALREGVMTTAVAYMAPEVALGHPADARSDLYSFGAVLYELSTGRPPFLADDPIGVLSQQIHTQPVPPSLVAKAVPPALDALILRLLAKLPEERPTSAEGVCEVLRTLRDTTLEPRRGGASPLDGIASGVYVGRSDLLERLRAGVEDAIAGRFCGFLLTGDAGIGKTRTAHELATYARMREVEVRFARCPEDEGAPALWPWVQILRAHAERRSDAELRAELGPQAGELTQLAPDLAERLGHPAPGTPTDDAREARFRHFNAWCDFARRVAVGRPLLLVLDDLHCADPTSVQLLTHLASEGPPRLAIVATYRDAEVGRRHPLHAALTDLARPLDALPLAGLGLEEVRRLVELSASSEPSEATVGALHEHTGGNPLFLTEVVRLLASENRLGEPLRNEAGAVPIPLGVRNTIRRRSAQLSKWAQAALTAAAAIGREFELDVLAEVTELPRDRLLGLLDQARLARLVEPVEGAPDAYRFCHLLVRDSLYDDLGSVGRQRLHGNIAEALRRLRPRRAAEIAHHYAQAPSSETAETAADYAARAGGEAAARLSFEHAARHFRAALRALDGIPEPGEALARSRAEVEQRLGLALWASGEREEAQRHFLEAAEQARRLGAPELLAEAAVGFAGRSDIVMDVPGSALGLLHEALEALPERDTPLRVRLLSALANCLYYAEEAERDAWSRQAVAMAERLGDPPTLFHALAARHYALFVPWRLDERVEIAERLLGLARDAGSRHLEAVARFWRTCDACEEGDMTRVDAEMRAHAQLADELRQPHNRWLSAAFGAMRAIAKGRLEEAEKGIGESFELGRRAQSPNALTLFGTQLFHLRRWQGRIDELRDVIEKIIERNPSLPVFRIGLPLIDAIADRRDAARAGFEEVAARDFADFPRDTHWLPLLTSAAEVCAYLHDAPRARLLLELLTPHADRVVVSGFATVWAGPVTRWLALLETVLGRYGEAEAHFAEALALLRRAGARPLTAQLLRERADMAAQRAGRGDREAARRDRAEARALFRDLGMPGLASAVPADDPAPEPRAGSPDAPAHHFVRDGRGWRIAFRGRSVQQPGSRGLDYLRQLLSSPGRELHVLELSASASPSSAAGRSPGPGLSAKRAEPGDVVLDETARNAYRDRVAALREELAEAESHGDLGRIEALRRERELLEAELARAFGLGGRARRTAGSSERARKAVSNRIRDAIRRIGREHPELARHLESSVRTGTYCSYRPESATEWIVD